jgi:hypothetical protein
MEFNLVPAATTATVAPSPVRNLRRLILEEILGFVMARALVED